MAKIFQGIRKFYNEYAVIFEILEVNTDFFLKPRLPETKNEAR